MTALARREVALGGLLALAGGLSVAGRCWHISPVAPPIDLAALMPARFGAWAAAPGAAAAVLPPADERTMMAVYSATLAQVYRAPGAEVLAVLAYAASESGALVVHRPESCYPAAGFEIVRDVAMRVGLAGGRAVPARLLTAVCAARVEQVLYWVRIGGDFPLSTAGEDVAAARARFLGRRADGMLVRFSMVSGDPGAAARTMAGFARDLCAAMDARGRALIAAA